MKEATSTCLEETGTDAEAESFPMPLPARTTNDRCSKFDDDILFKRQNFIDTIPAFNVNSRLNKLNYLALSNHF